MSSRLSKKVVESQSKYLEIGVREGEVEVYNKLISKKPI